MFSAVSRTSSHIWPGLNRSLLNLGSLTWIQRYMFSSLASIPRNLIIGDNLIFDENRNEDIINEIRVETARKVITNFEADVICFGKPKLEVIGKTLLPEKIFGTPIRQDIVHQVIRWQIARKIIPRKTKRVPEISGSNRKVRKQKGSGQARLGKLRAPRMRKGAKAHGPVLRDYSFKLNKKFRQFGIRTCLAAKFREGNLVIVDKLSMPTHKTKSLTELLNGLGWSEKSILFVDAEKEKYDKNFVLASRSIHKVDILPVRGVNVLDVVKKEFLVISLAALDGLSKRLLSPRKVY